MGVRSYLNSHARVNLFVRNIYRYVKKGQFDVVSFFIKTTGIGKRAELEQFKNKYVGQRCFIIGNGPSLKPEDLNKLKENNEICFASNRIDRIYKMTPWRADYICVIDRGFMDYAKNIEPQDYFNAINTDETKAIFLESTCKKIVKKCRTDESKIFYFRNDFRRSHYARTRKFSDDITVRIADLASVTSTAIQIAVYMGFQEIYLLGQDMTFSKYLDEDGKYKNDSEVVDYFDDGKKVEIQGYADKRGMFAGFREVLRVANGRQVKIYNSTRGGKLEIFPRISFDDIKFKP